ncbi:histidine kinase dimerization/phospho-acceptor domain-containing protein [Natronorubrum daqingense]|uniref:histidine kinase n=1 Tax=Natronorubrum daqingense TaxID=588898 RepID=A0A1N7FUN2_9EURY|nr:histidine kinase dimerization/phospho-acceptor domain-containing protein [Natronorubrum daqingense]APX97443.1 hypothetical protein BB347_12945 [Natronorubrum daqingense]SIS04041.1 PAS fold-containing protein [Natronorubrum daqingense]
MNAGLFRAGFDALPFEIALVDTAGTIVYANETWVEFGDANGNTHDTCWVGENYLRVCRRADDSTATLVADGIEALLAGTRTHFQLEYPCHSPDEYRWFHLEATSLTHDGERYALLAHVDITARKQAELQRDTQIEQLKTIVTVLSHDIRNPLGVIQGYAAKLETAEADSDAVEAIQESADRIADMIESILEFARTQSLNDVSRVTVADVARESWAQTATVEASLTIDSSGSV